MSQFADLGSDERTSTEVVDVQIAKTEEKKKALLNFFLVQIDEFFRFIFLEN